MNTEALLIANQRELIALQDRAIVVSEEVIRNLQGQVAIQDKIQDKIIYNLEQQIAVLKTYNAKRSEP